MVIQLTDYFRCDCGNLAHKVAETGEVIVYRCKCGATISYLPGEFWYEGEIEFIPSRWMYLRMAWANLKAFIRGR